MISIKLNKIEKPENPKLFTFEVFAFFKPKESLVFWSKFPALVRDRRTVVANNFVCLWNIESTFCRYVDCVLLL